MQTDSEHKAYDRMLREVFKVFFSGIFFFGGAYFFMGKKFKGLFFGFFMGILLAAFLLVLPHFTVFGGKLWFPYDLAPIVKWFPQITHFNPGLYGYIWLLGLISFTLVGLWWLSIIIPLERVKPFFFIDRETKNLPRPIYYIFPFGLFYEMGDYTRGHLGLLCFLSWPFLGVNAFLGLKYGVCLPSAYTALVEPLMLVSSLGFLLASFYIFDLMVSVHMILKKGYRSSQSTLKNGLYMVLIAIVLTVFVSFGLHIGLEDIEQEAAFLAQSGYEMFARMLRVIDGLGRPPVLNFFQGRGWS